jgi:gas vesicle protein
MNDPSECRGSSNTGIILVGFALGAVAGAGLALLLAPDSGRRTRLRLGSTARHLGKRIGETIDQARETVTELSTDARSALKTGQDAFLSD